MTKFSPESARVIPLLQNEDQGQLEKIAKFYNNDDQLVEEYKIYPDGDVGDACLGRQYSYNTSGERGVRVFVDSWTQSMEDQALPSSLTITDIQISSNEVQDGSVSGTTVGTFTSVGGLAPFTYSIVADPDNIFTVVGNALQLTDTADIADTPYSVTIRSTSVNGSTFDKVFSIEVVSLELNQFSTQFDGVNEEITFGDVFQKERTQQWSFSFWLKPNNFGSQRVFYSKSTDDANVRGLIFYIRATTGKLYIQMRSTTSLRAQEFNLSMTAAAWNHVVVTYSGNSNITGLTVYINNVAAPIGSSQSIGGTLLEGQTAVFGSRNLGVVPYVGEMDEVTIWDKELSSTEVNELYGGGNPTNPQSSSMAANLEHWYRMGDGDSATTLNDNEGTADGTLVNMDASNYVSDVP